MRLLPDFIRKTKGQLFAQREDCLNDRDVLITTERDIASVDTNNMNRKF